jgi:hypothetical protein
VLRPYLCILQVLSWLCRVALGGMRRNAVNYLATLGLQIYSTPGKDYLQGLYDREPIPTSAIPSHTARAPPGSIPQIPSVSRNSPQ